MDNIMQALVKCEAMVDAHSALCRPRVSAGEIDGTEIAFCKLGWTIRMPLKRRDARTNKRWHTVSEFGETLDEAVVAFAESLDHWARVL